MVMKLADYLLDQPAYGYGVNTLNQGSQVTPVASPLQGLARALQGAVGGLTAGYAIGQAKQERSADSEALASAMAKFNGGDVAGATQALAARPNLSDVAANFGMQTGLLGYKQKLETDLQNADAVRFGFPGAGGGQQQAIAPGGNAPNPNNIGNVRPTGASGGFVQSPDFDSGVQLAVKNVQAYPAAFNNGQPMTLQQIGQKWAPAGDGANNPGQWALNVSKISGLPVDQPIDVTNPQVAAQFARGVHGAEWGANAVRDPQAYAAALNGQASGQATAQNTPTGQPQTAANVPASAGSDTVNFQGVPLPRAALAAALGIRDHAERQKAIASVVNEAVKLQQTGVPLVDIRQADGSIVKVPQPQAAGMTSAREMPLAGNKEADIEILNKGDPASPEYQQAYNRLSQPQQSQGGQLLYPDMSGYRQPTGAGRQQAQVGVQQRDTPYAQFQMGNEIAKQYADNAEVKKLQAMQPVLNSMRAAVNADSKTATNALNIGLATLITGATPRGDVLRTLSDNDSLPGELRNRIVAASRAGGLDPETKARIMEIAEQRVKAQADAVAGLRSQFAQRLPAGTDPNVLLLGQPSAAPQQEGAGAAPKVRTFNPNTGRLE